MTTSASQLRRQDFSDAASLLNTRYPTQSPAADQSLEDPPLFEGALATRRLSCGLKLSTIDITALRESRHHAQVRRSLFVALAIDGVPGDYALDSGAQMPLPPGGAVMMTTRDSATISARYRSTQYFRSVLVKADPDCLVDEELATRVDALLTQTASTALRIDEQSLGLAHQLCRPSFSGLAGGLLIESCALTLLAGCLLQADRRNPRSHASAAVTVSRRDRERLRRVRDMMTASPDRPHNLSSLAREAGMSVTCLKTKFPVVFGRTVFAYLRDLRLDRAKQGLEREGWTASQAAYFVGYRHASNFATAFRRRYSVSPSDIRRA